MALCTSIEWPSESYVHQAGLLLEQHTLTHTFSFCYSYTQCIPSRFQKQVVRAAQQDREMIAVEQLQQVLSNIGASDKISHQELQTLFVEQGNAHGLLAPHQLAKMLL